MVCILVAAGVPAQVQTPAPADVAEGRRLFQQKCALCHVPAVRGKDPYGPRLSRAQVARSEEGVKRIIRSGVGRMPGFQYTLQAPQIDAIVAFLRTLETPPDRVLTPQPNP